MSNDNPFFEAQFKTLKYAPIFPDRFGSLADAGAFCAEPRPVKSFPVSRELRTTQVLEYDCVVVRASAVPTRVDEGFAGAC